MLVGGAKVGATPTSALDSEVTDVCPLIAPAGDFISNAISGGDKEEEKGGSGLDVGNIIQSVAGGSDDKKGGGERLC